MSLGDHEQRILFALARLDGEAHGAAVALEIAERSGRTVSPGALTVLERLQDKEYVEAWIGDSTPERGGRRRKMYRLMPAGVQALRSWYGGIRELAAGTAARVRHPARAGCARRPRGGLVMRHASTIALAGLSVALAAAYALSKVLESRLYGVAPTDPGAYGAAALLFAAVALVACRAPVARAVRMDPAVTLRNT